MHGTVGAATAGPTVRPAVTRRPGQSVALWFAWLLWLLTIGAVASVGSEIGGVASWRMLEPASWALGISSLATIGVVVVTRRVALAQGWLLLGFACCWSLGLLAYHLLRVQGAATSIELGAARKLIALGDVFFVLALHGLFVLLLIVPTGRPPSARWRPLLYLIAVSAMVWVAFTLSTVGALEDVSAWLGRRTWAANDGLALRATEQLVFGASQAVGVGITLLVACAFVIRFRHSRGETRQQLKWVMVGGAAVLAWLLLWLPQPKSGLLLDLQPLLPGLAFTALAASFGFALLKHRLWDVDVVVRRSLVYGVLVVAIGAGYAALAAALGLFAGAALPLEAAIASTVAAALLFQPVRHRAERAADEWLFGRRASTAVAIQRFTDSIRSAERPDDVAQHLEEAAMRVARLLDSKVLLDGKALGSGVHEIAIQWGHERFGSLRYTPHADEDLSTDEIAALEAVATQTAIALSRSRLAERLVREEGRVRRRIERDIHDGVQQDLATLIAGVGLERADADARGDVSGAAALDRVREGLQRMLANLRDLTQGIHPSVLRDGGLAAALDDVCSRVPIPIQLSTGSISDARFSADIEAAAYFFVAEAMTNALKHSGSQMVTVSVVPDRSDLVIRVADQGRGIGAGDIGGGTGLAGLADRIQALGGTMSVQGLLPHGTVLVARLPITQD